MKPAQEAQAALAARAVEAAQAAHSGQTAQAVQAAEVAGVIHDAKAPQRASPAVSRRKIYIDLGARNGDTLELFAKKHPSEIDSGAVEMWAFECNPDNQALLRQAAERLCQEHPAMQGHIHLVFGAAWNATGVIPFHTDARANLLTGGSVYSSPYAQGDVVEVPSFDMASWMREHLSPTEDVVVKMDIEGAEFPVLRRLMQDGVAQWVKEWVVEFHGGSTPHSANPWASPDTNMKIEQDFFDMVKRYHMVYTDWH